MKEEAQAVIEKEAKMKEEMQNELQKQETQCI